jgi:hypothetical protein
LLSNHGLSLWGESRRWTVCELVERLKNLGICASRASVMTAALAELALPGVNCLGSSNFVFRDFEAIFRPFSRRSSSRRRAYRGDQAQVSPAGDGRVFLHAHPPSDLFQ